MVRVVPFLLIVLAIAVPAMAQPRPAPPSLPPPRPGPPLGGPGRVPRPGLIADEGDLEDIRPWLAGKMINSKQKDVDPKVLKDLMDKLNKMPKDEQPDKAQIEKMLKDNPAFKDPKFLEQLEKMLQDPDFPKNLEGKLPKDGVVRKQGEGKELAEKLKDVIDAGKQGGDPKDAIKGVDAPKVDPKVSELGTGKGPNGDGKSPYAENEWVKWMEKNFGNSPAAQDAVKDLVGSLQKGDMNGVFDDLPDFKNGNLKGFDDFGGPKGGNDWNFKPPDLSSGKSSSWGNGGGGGGSSWGGGGGGSSGGVGGVGLGGGGTALMVIAGIAAAIFLALMLFRRWKMEQARRAAHGAVGKAGIDFDSIRTREELVQAFDHVSLDQIGEEARSWNHRVIADQFVETRPTQAEPATELAGLYERARYAPLDEDLSAGEFADARRDLRTLAESPA